MLPFWFSFTHLFISGTGFMILGAGLRSAALDVCRIVYLQWGDGRMSDNDS